MEALRKVKKDAFIGCDIITGFPSETEEAFLEGEGNRSLRDWQTIFGDYWRKTLPEEGLEFSESGLVVTEIFTVLEDYLLDNEENGRSK